MEKKQKSKFWSIFGPPKSSCCSVRIEEVPKVDLPKEIKDTGKETLAPLPACSCGSCSIEKP